MCMRFGCNPQINFCHFFCVELRHFLAYFLPKHLDIEYLVKANPHIYPDLFETLQVFCLGLKMCM